MSKLTSDLKFELLNCNEQELNDAFKNACRYGHMEIIEYLLYSSNFKEKVNQEAMMCNGFKHACKVGKTKVILYLISLQRGIYLNFQKTEYNLDWAMQEKKSDTLKLFMSFGNKDAVIKDNHKIVEYMVKSLYKNDMIAYIENFSKIEQYCQTNGLNHQEWKDDVEKTSPLLTPYEEMLQI